MNFHCDRCGKDPYDHTLREMQNDVCTQPVGHGFTAKLGMVNPEVLDDTGEQIDVRQFRSDFYVPERAQRKADEIEKIIESYRRRP